MNAYSFNGQSACCPICHRTNGIKPVKMVRGLLTCEYCRERLVVSWSGHYVRDPFTVRPRPTGQMLRRQSRPLARILRDAGLTRQSSLLALCSGLLLAGLTTTYLLGVNLQWFPLGRSPNLPSQVEGN